MRASGHGDPCYIAPPPRLFLEPTLSSHFLNAKVSFLRPIEEPITISGAARLSAYNDMQNASACSSSCLATTLLTPPPSLCVTPANSRPPGSIWKRAVPLGLVCVK